MGVLQGNWKTYLGNLELGVHHQAQSARLVCSTLPHPTKSSYAQATGSQEQLLPAGQPGPSTAMPSKEMHRRRQTTSTFCEVYKAHSERRTAALESLVRPDLERRRRLKERRRRMF